MVNSAKPRLRDIFTDIFTISNGKDWCYGKIFGAGIIVYALYRDHTDVVHASFRDFCYGMGALLGAIGALIFMKKKDEPGDTQ